MDIPGSVLGILLSITFPIFKGGQGDVTLSLSPARISLSYIY